MTLTPPAPAGYRFPRQVIAIAVRWYLRYGLYYRDVEELLAERGIDVDHITLCRRVQTFSEVIVLSPCIGRGPGLEPTQIGLDNIVWPTGQ